MQIEERKATAALENVKAAVVVRNLAELLCRQMCFADVARQQTSAFASFVTAVKNS